MKLMTFSVPKISDKPAATRNSSMPLINPPVVCVTTQEAEAKHASIACKSKGTPGRGFERLFIPATPSCASGTGPDRFGSGVSHGFFPLGLVLENRLPVAGSHVRNVGLLGDG